MSQLSGEQIKKYDSILKKILGDLEAQRINRGNVNVPERYLDFIKRLNMLVEALAAPKSEKDWFMAYQSVYEDFFFDHALNPFNNLVSVDFISIWLSLGIREKEEVAKLNDQLYRFINVAKLTDNSLEQRVIKPFEAFSKTISLSYEVTQQGIASGHDAQKRAKVFRLDYAKNEQKMAVSCWAEPDYVHIIIQNEGFDPGFISTIIDALFKHLVKI